jgi:hypothetical protein
MQRQPMVYQIRIKGYLSRQWADWFEGLTITLEEDGDTLQAVICYLASVGLLLAVMNFSFSIEAFSGAMLSIGSRGANLLRWGMIFDVFGSYLLFVPLALHLWSWLKPRSPNHVTFYTLCGFAYILIGSMGAIVLSAVLPPLIHDYSQASATQRVHCS